jgi:hypothetical protein
MMNRPTTRNVLAFAVGALLLIGALSVFGLGALDASQRYLGARHCAARQRQIPQAGELRSPARA